MLINKNTLILAFLLALFIFMWWQQPILEKFNSLQSPYYPPTQAYSQRDGTNPIDPTRTPNYDAGVIVEPSYLNDRAARPSESIIFAQSVIDKQADQIRTLRKKVQQLAYRLDDEGTNKFYRTKLSNKYYRPKPFLSNGSGFDNVLNLGDDDFSTKTLSTIKFLSQTRPSKYFGEEIHFPSELCGNFCTTSDPNAQLNEQIDLIRPITPVGNITTRK